MKYINSVISKSTNFVNLQNKHLIIFLLFLIILFSQIFITKFASLAGDMAEYLNNPLRIINGELPYKDFWLLFTPGEVFFPAAIYKIFGLNIDYVKYGTMLISVLSIIPVFYFGKKIFETNINSIMLVILFYFTSVINYYTGAHYIHLFFIFICYSSFSLILFLKSGKSILLFISGLFIGIAFYFRFYESGAACFASSLVLLINIIMNKDDKKKAALTTLNFIY